MLNWCEQCYFLSRRQEHSQLTKRYSRLRSLTVSYGCQLVIEDHLWGMPQIACASDSHLRIYDRIQGCLGGEVLKAECTPSPNYLSPFSSVIVC